MRTSADRAVVRRLSGRIGWVPGAQHVVADGGQIAHAPFEPATPNQVWLLNFSEFETTSSGLGDSPAARATGATTSTASVLALVHRGSAFCALRAAPRIFAATISSIKHDGGDHRTLR